MANNRKPSPNTWPNDSGVRERGTVTSMHEGQCIPKCTWNRILHVLKAEEPRFLDFQLHARFHPQNIRILYFVQLQDSVFVNLSTC